MPTAGIELRELAPRESVGSSVAARRAVERIVMQQERDAVGRQLHIDFGHSITMRIAEAQRRQRVFGRALAGAPMCCQARIRPRG
jgi:hypothetical protein